MHRGTQRDGSTTAHKQVPDWCLQCGWPICLCAPLQGVAGHFWIDLSFCIGVDGDLLLCLVFCVGVGGDMLFDLVFFAGVVGDLSFDLFLAYLRRARASKPLLDIASSAGPHPARSFGRPPPPLGRTRPTPPSSS